MQRTPKGIRAVQSQRSRTSLRMPEPSEPLTSVAARLEAVEPDLALETRHRVKAEHNLAGERERISDLYRELERKRGELEDLLFFAAMQYVRVPAFRPKILRISDSIHRAWFTRH